MQNSKASLEVRELKDELSEEQLQKVYGGKASFHDLNFVHKLDKASPVLMRPVRPHWRVAVGGTVNAIPLA